MEKDTVGVKKVHERTLLNNMSRHVYHIEECVLGKTAILVRYTQGNYGNATLGRKDTVRHNLSAPSIFQTG